MKDLPLLDTDTTIDHVNLKGGVMVVGSLFWDPSEIREEWRKGLSYQNRRKIPAPICYGRVSQSRRCTHTIVLSVDCDTIERRGTAVFIPLPEKDLTLEMLHSQSVMLIRAERNKRLQNVDLYHWGWGSLGLLINPSRIRQSDNDEISAHINGVMAFWKTKYDENSFKPSDFRVGEEDMVINDRGCLQIAWPDNLDEFDFLIATVTRPELIAYPSPEEIANRMIINGYDSYFKNNVANGIRTYQDGEILQSLDSHGVEPDIVRKEGDAVQDKQDKLDGLFRRHDFYKESRDGEVKLLNWLLVISVGLLITSTSNVDKYVFEGTLFLKPFFILIIVMEVLSLLILGWIRFSYLVFDWGQKTNLSSMKKLIWRIESQIENRVLNEQAFDRRFEGWIRLQNMIGDMLGTSTTGVLLLLLSILTYFVYFVLLIWYKY